MNIKCQKCGSYESDVREFMECQACGDYAWIHDPLGRVQLYNPGTNRKATQPISYTLEQLSRDLKTFKVKRSDLYRAIGFTKFDFSRVMNEAKEIPQYVQAALWMYFEILKLRNTEIMQPKRVINIAKNANQQLNTIAERIGRDPEDLAGELIAKIVLEPRTYFVCCPKCDVEMFDDEMITVSGVMSGQCINGHEYRFDLDTGKFV